MVCPMAREIVSWPVLRYPIRRKAARHEHSFRRVSNLRIHGTRGRGFDPRAAVGADRHAQATQRCGGFIYAVLGVVYAVLLGFMVVAVWEEWNAAAATTDEEATALSEIFWIAGRMPEGHHIQDLARSYA